MKRYVTLLTCLAAFFSMAASAGEIDYQLNYSGRGVEGSLLITTDGVLNSSGAYTIDAVSGVRNGVTIDGLLPAGYNPSGRSCGHSICWVLQSDNDFFPGTPSLDLYGLTYAVGGGYGVRGGNDINLFYDNGTYFDITESATAAKCDGRISCSYLGTPVTVSVSVSTVPEPGTLALLAAGLAGLGFAFSRRSRKAA